ncbi:MAG TPA: methylenetetrahydrofolate reductase C-terminal domain-containing protein [Methanomassiliicoccales archaeon]|jgi:ferredoxin
MIIAEQKPLNEVIEMLEGHSRVLVVGCRSCVAVCLAGGEKEAGILAESLRLHSDLKGKEWEVEEVTLERVCEKEWVRGMDSDIEGKDVVLSLACGVGAQVIHELYPGMFVVPGVNTISMGAPEEQGIYLEKCGGCGDCVLHLTGGVCPVARCSKSLMNGPCGGSQNGKCEIDPDTPCGWDQIYRSLKELNRLDLMETAIPPKNWRPSRSGGPRKTVRKEAVQTDEEKKIRGASP